MRIPLFKRKKPKTTYDVHVSILRRDFMSCLVQISEFDIQITSDVEPTGDTIRNHAKVENIIQADLKRRDVHRDRYWVEESHEVVNDQSN